MNIENNDKYCFIWLILAYLHLCKKIRTSGVSNYKQYFDELNIESFDFTNGFKCSDVHRFIELNNLSNKIFELNFYQDQNKWRRKLIPIDISKNFPGRVIDSAIYKTKIVIFLFKN